MFHRIFVKQKTIIIIIFTHWSRKKDFQSREMILHHRNHHQQGLTVAGKLPRRYEKTEKKERKKEKVHSIAMLFSEENMGNINLRG